MGKQIATELMKMSHRLKVPDNVKAACVLSAAKLPVHAPPQPSHNGLRMDSLVAVLEVHVRSGPAGQIDIHDLIGLRVWPV